MKMTVKISMVSKLVRAPQLYQSSFARALDENKFILVLSLDLSSEFDVRYQSTTKKTENNGPA
jgi:hypothetical protein